MELYVNSNCIAFPNYTPTQAKVSRSADRRRARGALRAGELESRQ